MFSRGLSYYFLLHGKRQNYYLNLKLTSFFGLSGDTPLIKDEVITKNKKAKDREYAPVILITVARKLVNWCKENLPARCIELLY